MSSTFERSPAGIANRRLFFGVDAVVYVEGGVGDGGLPSIDGAFWQSRIRLFWPSVKVRCIARGGKTHLLQLLSSILISGTKSSFVALDRDHDDLCARGIDSHNVLYTFGYSWENDIFFDKTIIEWIWDRLAGSGKERVASSRYTLGAREFRKQVSGLCSYDFVRAKNGLTGFPRHKYRRFLAPEDVVSGCIDVAQVANALGSHVVFPDQKVSPYVVQRRLYGHLLADGYIAVLTCILRRHIPSFRFDKEDLLRSLIRIDESSQDKNSRISTYYLRMFAVRLPSPKT